MDAPTTKPRRSRKPAAVAVEADASDGDAAEAAAPKRPRSRRKAAAPDAGVDAPAGDDAAAG